MTEPSRALLPHGSQQLDARTKAELALSDESIRVLIRKHLPHGTKEKVADLSDMGADQVSRQLNGREGIQNIVVMASRRFLPEAIAAAVVTIQNGGAPSFTEQTALIVRFTDGQMFLPGVK